MSPPSPALCTHPSHGKKTAFKGEGSNRLEKKGQPVNSGVVLPC